MNKTLYLHIGAPKTGTSFIQACLAKNIDHLDSNGIGYPQVGDDFSMGEKGLISSGNGGLLASYLVPSKRKSSFSEKRFLAEFSDLFKSHDKVLLSSEVFSGATSDNLTKFHSYLAKNEIAVEVLFYVRSYLDFALSIWMQKIKRKGYTGGWENYIESATTRPPFLNVLKKFEDFCSGESDKLHVVNYDAVKKDLISSFCSELSIEKLPFVFPGTINRSLSEEEIAFLLYFNSQIPSDSTDKKRGSLSRIVSDNLNYFGTGEKAPLCVPVDLYVAFVKKFDHHLRYINKRYLNSSTELTFSAGPMRNRTLVVDTLSKKVKLAIEGLYIFLSKSLKGVKLTDSDISSYNTVLYNSLGNPGLLNAIANTLIDSKRPALAVRFAQKAVDLRPQETTFSLTLSNALIRTKQFELAKDILSEILAHYPEETQAVKYMNTINKARNK